MSGRCAGSSINIESINNLSKSFIVPRQRERTTQAQGEETNPNALLYGEFAGCRYLPDPTAMAMLPPPAAGSSNGE